ncbi:uncharacterized protein LOC100456904 [Pongo abelii]|uniref:uncharacterized protein LOC100456904 n=1 Tax=Pongo abelii TaxID=9601 RepID=UPI0023E8C304|nr:uncharacterized protein LOC100456904 [Pongo abelii]
MWGALVAPRYDFEQSCWVQVPSKCVLDSPRTMGQPSPGSPWGPRNQVLPSPSGLKGRSGDTPTAARHLCPAPSVASDWHVWKESGWHPASCTTAPDTSENPVQWGSHSHQGHERERLNRKMPLLPNAKVMGRTRGPKVPLSQEHRHRIFASRNNHL